MNNHRDDDNLTWLYLIIFNDMLSYRLKELKRFVNSKLKRIHLSFLRISVI